MSDIRDLATKDKKNLTLLVHYIIGESIIIYAPGPSDDSPRLHVKCVPKCVLNFVFKSVFQFWAHMTASNYYLRETLI